MARNVRNFWVEGTTYEDLGQSGRSVAFGPRASTGEFSLTIKMRDRGEIVTALRVQGAQRNGKLVLLVAKDSGEVIAEVKTDQ